MSVKTARLLEGGVRLHELLLELGDLVRQQLDLGRQLLLLSGEPIHLFFFFPLRTVRSARKNYNCKTNCTETLNQNRKQYARPMLTNISAAAAAEYYVAVGWLCTSDDFVSRVFLLVWSSLSHLPGSNTCECAHVDYQTRIFQATFLPRKAEEVRKELADQAL